MAMRFKDTIFFPLAIIAFAGFGLASCNKNEGQDIVGTLEWDRIELVAETTEPITEIRVKVGERVKAGDIILKLDDSRQRAVFAQSRARQKEAAARLAELKRGPRAERIVDARARVKGAESALVSRRHDYQRGEELHKKQLLSDQELDRLRALRDSAKAQYDEARAKQDELLAGTTREELEQARQTLAVAKAAVRTTTITLKRLTVRAPVDGLIDTLPYKKGEHPAAGTVVAVILSGAAPYARVYVPEPMRALVDVGTVADVKVDGIDNLFQGRVRNIASDPAFTPYYALTERDRSRLSYLAEIELIESRANRLPAGLPVSVRLHPNPIPISEE